MPYGCHIYITSVYMDISTMCDFPSDKHALPHWKYVLRCCSTCPGIATHNKEYHNTTKTICPTIRFFVLKVVSRCTVNGKLSFEEK